MKKLGDILKTEIRIPGPLGRVTTFLVRGTYRTLTRSPRSLGRAATLLVRATLKPLKWGLRALVALVILAIVAGSVLNVIGGRRYAAELQKLKDSGEPYTVVDLAGPPVPDSDNGAVVYQKVIDSLPERGGPDNVYGQLYNERAMMTPADWQNARRVAAEYEWVLPMVEEAAARPECKFPVRWQDGFAVQLPHLAGLRRVSRTLALQAIVSAHDGDTESAVRCVQAGLLAANALQNEPTIISLLVRLSQLNNACQAVRAVTEEANLNTSQAKTLYDQFSQVDLRPHAVLSAKGERGFGLLMFAQARKTSLRHASSITGNDHSVLKAGLWRPLLYFDALAYLRFMQRQIERAGKPYRDIKADMSETAMFKDIPKWCLLTRLVVPVYGRLLASVDRAAANCALAQTAMALNAYKNNYGTYPGTLADASLALGWEIPEDPFSGESLIYKRHGAGFVVYSIGSDLKDDGGTPPPKNDSTAGDIVWSLDR